MKKTLNVNIALFFWVVFFSGVLFSCSCSSSSRQVWNLSHENLFFVGREEELQAIHSFFKKEKRQILALTGGPGFGKTQIAKKYAQQFYKDYRLMWWFDAQQDIPSQFEKMAAALNHILPEKEKIILSTLSKDALVDRVKDILRVKNIPFLLIFDNAETYDQIEKYLPYTYQEPRKHVLLTSRYANIWTDKVEVRKFKRKDSIALIKQNLPKSNDADIENLAKTLSDYPLGLTLAIGFIKSAPTTTIQKYLSMHMKRTLKSGEKPPSTLLDRYANDAQATLTLSLKFIEENSKDALKALLFMSLLNSKDIPETYIESWLKHTKSPLTADEAIKYIYDQSLIGVSETTEFNDKNGSQGVEQVHYLSIHDLIHQLINEKISLEEKKELIEVATNVMLDIFAGPSEVFTKKILIERIHLLHAQKLCENARKINYSSPQLLQLKICVFECLMGGVRDFEAARLCLEDIEHDLKAGHKIPLYYQALYNMNKGFFETTHPNVERAIYYMQRGLSILNNLKGYNEERLRALTNLAQYYSYLGKTNVAETLIERGKKIFERSTSEVFNCLFFHAWAFVLNDQGKFEDSLNVLKKVSQYSTLSINYPTVELFILYQKARALIKLNRLEDAHNTLTECEEKAKVFYQTRKDIYFAHISVLKTLLLINRNKEIRKSIENLKIALQTYKDFFHGNDKHSAQARAHFALGKAYANQKNYAKALQEFLLSDDVYNKILKEKKIDDVSELYKDLTLLGVKMKDEKIVHTYLKGLRKNKLNDYGAIV